MSPLDFTLACDAPSDLEPEKLRQWRLLPEVSSTISASPGSTRACPGREPKGASAVPLTVSQPRSTEGLRNPARSATSVSGAAAMNDGADGARAVAPKKNSAYVAIRVCRSCGKSAWMRKKQFLCSLACKGRVWSIKDDPLEDFLWRRVSPEPNSGCWLWTGTISQAGYGVVNGQKRGGKFAHRLAYQVWKGPIPHGLHLDHLCRVRCCINPGHLEPVTHQENIKRGLLCEVSPNRARKRTHCSEGHLLDDANIYWQGNGRRCRICMKAYNKAAWLRRKAAGNV